MATLEGAISYRIQEEAGAFVKQQKYLWSVMDECSAAHSLKVYRSPIETLHRLHIGIRLSRTVRPPFDSGMLCPA